MNKIVYDLRRFNFDVNLTNSIVDKIKAEFFMKYCENSSILESMQNQSELKIDILKKFIYNISEKLFPIDLAFLSGSIARKNATKFSDIDITIILSNDYHLSQEEYNGILELYNYYISYIFNLTRMRVHSMRTYLKNQDLMSESVNFDEDLIVEILMNNDDNKLSYVIPKMYVHHFVNEMNSTKDMNSIINYINKRQGLLDSDFFIEDAYNYINIINSTKIKVSNQRFEALFDKEIYKDSKLRWLKRCKDLINRLKSHNIYNICEIKEMTKTIPLKLIYTFAYMVDYPKYLEYLINGNLFWNTDFWSCKLLGLYEKYCISLFNFQDELNNSENRLSSKNFNDIRQIKNNQNIIKNYNILVQNLLNLLENILKTQEREK